MGIAAKREEASRHAIVVIVTHDAAFADAMDCRSVWLASITVKSAGNLSALYKISPPGITV